MTTSQTLLQENDLFYGTSGPRDARIAIVGESWGSTERDKEKPFVGASGKELDKLLAESGLPDRSHIFMTNVVAQQPPGNDMTQFFIPTGVARSRNMMYFKGLFPRSNVVEGIATLKKQLEAVKPDIIIGFGNYTLWALTDGCYKVADDKGFKVPRGIGEWRGSQLFVDIKGRKVPFMPTYHPAAIFRTWPWRYLIKHDLTMRVRQNLDDIEDAWTPPERTFHLRPSASDVVDYVHYLLASAPLDLAVDLETRGKSYISCVGLAPSQLEAMCIPFVSIAADNYYSVEDELQVTMALGKLLSHPDIHICGQNFLYDMQYIIRYLHCRPRVTHDTMLYHHVCWPGGGDPEKKSGPVGVVRKTLYNIASLYCNHYIYWKDEGRDWEPWMGDEQHWNYNCLDCTYTYESVQVLKQLVQSLGLQDQAQSQIDTANDLAFEMMLNGVRVDKKRRAEVALDLAAKLEEYQAYIDSLVPEDVFPRDPKKKSWVNSPTQQQTLFYDVLGVKPVFAMKKNAKGERPRTVNKEALPIIAKRSPIVGGLISRLEEYRKISTAYTKGTQAPIDPDGKMRCTFNPAGTETFRWNSTENAFGRGTNMQNISKGTEDDPDAKVKLPNIRKFFVPDPGFEMMDADLSGADAQVVAWEAEDDDLKDAFRKGLKLHIKNARDVWPHETRNMTDEDLKKTDHQGGMYYKCKRRVHGFNYVGSPKTMAMTLSTSVKEEEEFYERWFYLHPGIKLWHERYSRYLSGEQCWNCDHFPELAGKPCPSCGSHLGRTIRNAFGFRIVFFDRVDGLLPQAVAWTPQSTVALVCTKGGLAVRHNHPWVQLLMHNHDSLVMQYPENERRRRHEIKETLHSIVVPYKDPLTIPWGADVGTKSWGELEKLSDW